MELSQQQMLASTLKYEQEEAWISDLDPILEGGFKVVFRSQICLQLRTFDEDGSTVGLKDVLNIRIISNSASEGMGELKIEISSEDDIFKVYVCIIDDRKFEKMRKAQHLNFNFKNLLPMLVKQIHACEKHLNQYIAVFYLNKISSHRLDFLENIEYKRIELISLDFEELDPENLKNYITFRFTKMKAKNQIIQNRLRDIMGIVKLKNPNLITVISKKMAIGMGLIK